MPKKHLTITDSVMSRIQREHIAMRPKWVFIAGTAAIFIGLVGSFITSAFIVSLVAFSLRTHGPMGEIRLQQLISSFPWWAPVLLVAGIGAGIALLRSFDFSYKKNFTVIIVSLIASVLVAGWLIDITGLDAFWSGRGGLNRMYRSLDGGYGRGTNGEGDGRRMHRMFQDSGSGSLYGNPQNGFR